MIGAVTVTSNIYFYLTSGYVSTATEELPLIHTWSLALYQARNNITIEQLQAIKEKYKLRIIDSTRALCDAKNCYAVKQNIALYFDGNHLSVSGADMMLRNFATN